LWRKTIFLASIRLRKRTCATLLPGAAAFNLHSFELQKLVAEGAESDQKLKHGGGGPEIRCCSEPAPTRRT